MEKESLLKDKNIININKQNNVRYEKEVIRFENISVIAIALSIMALVLIFTIAFTYKKPGIGISSFIVFTLISTIVEIININLTVIRLKEIDFENVKKALRIKLLRRLYKISFIVIAINITESIFLIPFYGNDSITTSEFFNFTPVFITLTLINIYLLRAIAHFRLKSNRVYQIAGNPFIYFSKKYLVLILVFIIIAFDTNILLQIVPLYFMECLILLPLFYGIVSLLNYE